MKCAEAMRSLEDARREFASRYMHWLLAESARECDSGYARIRRFPSPVTLRFLDFVETDTLTDAEAELRQRIPEAIEDANTWLDARLAARVRGKQ